MGKLKDKMPEVDVKKVGQAGKGIFKEFKEFAMKGSIVDLAIGMIIGSAFTSIVNSFVTDVITPVISLLTRGIDFSQLYIPLYRVFDKEATYESLAAAQEAGAAVITYGNFITAILNFLIVAAVIFVVFKKILVPRPKKNEPAPAPTEKECPYCKSTINIEATRCPHCTSELN